MLRDLDRDQSNLWSRTIFHVSLWASITKFLFQSFDRCYFTRLEALSLKEFIFFFWGGGVLWWPKPTKTTLSVITLQK